jgi:hypothetical protein
MDDTLNGRAIYAVKGPTGDFKEPEVELCALADATALAPGLFARDGALHWLDEGKVKAVSGEVLAELISKYVVTQRVVGTPGKSDWRIEYTPYHANQREIRALLMANTLKSGSLIGRVKAA